MVIKKVEVRTTEHRRAPEVNESEMIIPRFYANLKDNNHCLQACIKMVLSSFGHELSWKDLEKLTSFQTNLYSWTSAAASGIARYIPGTKLVTTFDYQRFADKGEDYLKSLWDSSWFQAQKLNASDGFKREQNFAIELVTDRSFVLHKGNFSVEELENFLKSNWMIALVDGAKLSGEGTSGHFVLVYEQNDNNFIFHNPGLKQAVESAQIEKSNFMDVFRNELILVPIAR